LEKSKINLRIIIFAWYALYNDPAGEGDS